VEKTHTMPSTKRECSWKCSTPVGLGREGARSSLLIQLDLTLLSRLGPQFRPAEPTQANLQKRATTLNYFCVQGLDFCVQGLDRRLLPPSRGGGGAALVLCASALVRSSKVFLISRHRWALQLEAESNPPQSQQARTLSPLRLPC
jgi:hypothetical protein